MINYRFNIIKKIGEGRSKVFLITDIEHPDLQLAIKLLQHPFSEEECKIFKEEFLLLERLVHPNIVKVYESETVLIVDEDDLKYSISPNSKFFVMEYFNGKSLLEFEDQMNEHLLREIISPICYTLYYLHQSNYIYSDLKPENILLKIDNGIPNIKLLDFGFTKSKFLMNEFNMQGSAEYIAPEILRKEKYDHRADLYSLGMTLYRIIYGKFPFNTKTEVDIFKAHLETEFDFPNNGYSEKITSVVKKLLSKNPEERFKHTLEILQYLDIDIDNKIKRYFTPIGNFSGREEIILKLNLPIDFNDSNSISVIKGPVGSGKTALSEYIKNKFDNVFYLNKDYAENIITFWKKHLRSFILNSELAGIDHDVLNEIFEIINPNSQISLDYMKQFMIRISRILDFTFIVDDFNRFDNLNLEFIGTLIPIFFSNNIRIVLFENSNQESVIRFPVAVSEMVLPAFDKNELDEFLNNNFNGFFPREALKEVLIQSSDFNPGSLTNFFSEAINFGVLDFNGDGPFINYESNKIDLLKGSQAEIIESKMNGLAENELKLLEILSLFNINIDLPTVSLLSNNNADQASKILQKLVNVNFISVSKFSGQIYFASDFVKQFVYNKILNVELLHSFIAEIINLKLPDFKISELARQYELSKLYDKAYEIYLKDIFEAEKYSAYKYIEYILEHLITLPLDAEKEYVVKAKLSKTLKILGDNIKSLELVNSLLDNYKNAEIKDDLMILKGSCLISLGELNAGVEYLNNILAYYEEEKKINIMAVLASAYIDLGKFTLAETICREVISNERTKTEDKAKAYNLLALIEIYEKGNLELAIQNLNQAHNFYEELNNISRVVDIEVNLGNIYNMKGETKKAEEYWNKSLQKNLSIGNLELEANLLLNFGINQFNNLNFELALANYKRANNIFSGSGNRNGCGLSLLNQGETCLAICEYQDAIDSLNKAYNIFTELQNHTEEAESIFLLGELFFRINSSTGLELMQKKFNELLEKGFLVEKSKNDLLFLNALISISKNDYEIDCRNLLDIKSKYLEFDDKQGYLKSLFIFCWLFIDRNELAKAYSLLNENELLNECDHNNLVKAERDYYLGKISAKSKEFNLNVAVEYYEAAYRLLENESINRLLCSVLFELTKYYFGRGNIKKCEEYFYYCKNLIYFISENINSNELRDCFLNSIDIKQYLMYFNQIEDKIS
jgi:serine/threonine protein kinase